MFVVYQAGSNTATNGTTISEQSDSEADIVVLRMIVGAPVSAGNIVLYKISNPLGSSTANIAFKMTLPTFSTTNVNPGVYNVDFGPKGLPLPEGGNIQIDQTMNVTLICAKKDEAIS